MGAFHHRQQQRAQTYDLLPPERRAPLRSAADRFERRRDVSDAEFVILSPSRANGEAVSAARRAHVSPPRLPFPWASFAGFCLRGAERWLQRASARSFAGLVAALCILVFGLAGGFSGSAGGAAASSLSPPLQFSHVTLTPRDQNGMRVLVLNGIVENRAAETSILKPIRADLMAGDRMLASVVVAPPAERLDAGESRGFMARLQHPGGKMPEVRLSFMP